MKMHVINIVIESENVINNTIELNMKMLIKIQY